MVNLLGKIGDDVFKIGNVATDKAEDSGHLQLLANDGLGGYAYSDNTGHVLVQFRVLSKLWVHS